MAGTVSRTRNGSSHLHSPVVPDVLDDPGHVAPFGAVGGVLEAQDVAGLIDQFHDDLLRLFRRRGQVALALPARSSSARGITHSAQTYTSETQAGS